jgi:hypothetical protein
VSSAPLLPPLPGTRGYDVAASRRVAHRARWPPDAAWVPDNTQQQLLQARPCRAALDLPGVPARVVDRNGPRWAHESLAPSAGMVTRGHVRRRLSGPYPPGAVSPDYAGG